ncbi:mitochondrial 54S ribosomal protein bL17m NDAI_0B04810 [Naumovozyma dairenensis CBS 421]|uniref:Large ribosomal subunit protein bL17m C-terminal fungi domain-containing protein n=1 Tax=Naumovozyma dairenensis (strain ATCC 10597 / BCRC 20456 / CBS 421 / NBRC 0211 / NRRL Y-12639) TaxID=1071378 RepID=G0W6V4_NAUDC|nr:hypothetical protein NDAI_0B04810 [Naumovozyma dairenensis CBS 421]CCD23515.1 hypothetical protein NDAI_0B04810 [Naumovozyma dairenensis CBS 421]
MTVGITRKLNRTKPHRDALFKNLVTQLFQHGTIISTHEKCKEASRLADRLITMGKKIASDDQNTTKSSSLYLPHIQSKLFLSGDNSKLISKLFNDIIPVFKNRNGGYTRVLKLESRLGDRADQSILELVDFLPVKTNSTEMGLNKGNMKLWLLINNIVKSNHLNDVKDITWKNLYKIGQFKDKETFSNDILQITKFLKLNENNTNDWNESKEIDNVNKIIEKIYSFIPNKCKTARINEFQKKGYVIMDKRPERPSPEQQLH